MRKNEQICSHCSGPPASLLLSGYLAGLGKSVRQSDLDAWRGAPVAELVLHSWFSTITPEIVATKEGYEVWNYKNEETRTTCFQFGCVTRTGGCNNQFIVHEAHVIEYRPRGYGGVRCFTEAFLRPEGYLSGGRQE